MVDFVKDAATLAAMELADGDWNANPFRFFRGVVLDKTFTFIPSEVELLVNLAFRPELFIPLMVLPSSSILTIHAEKFSVGKVVISLASPGRVVALVGRFDSQVTGLGVK